MSRLRNFCFTLNNYTDIDIRDLQNLKFRYLIIGKEVGKSGTPHLQGYCELTGQMKFSSLKTMFPTMHIEKRQGTAKQASDYCEKEGNFAKYGEISHQGSRTDIENLYFDAKANVPDTVIGETNPAGYMRYYKAIDRVKFNYAMEDKSFEAPTVHVLYGASGVGKTRFAYQLDPNLYSVRVAPSPWFDGYQGQETILLDDYYGEIGWGLFLQLLDGYKFSLPIKGGFTWKRWKTVVLTSNVHPENWYPEHGFPEEFQRRITTIERVAS